MAWASLLGLALFVFEWVINLRRDSGAIPHALAAAEESSKNQGALQGIDGESASLESRSALSSDSVAEADESNVVLVELIGQCIQSRGSVPLELWSCLRELDFANFSSEELAAWVCSTNSSEFLATQLVCAEAFHARLPAELPRFVEDFQQDCSRYAETPLTVAALAAIGSHDLRYVRELEKQLTPTTLLPESGSIAVIQLAEYFMDQANGSGNVRLYLEDIGRGFLVGSPDQAHRAALIVYVNTPDPVGRLHYLESVLYSSESPAGRRLAQFMVEGLSDAVNSKECENLHPFDSLKVLLSDPRFAYHASTQLLSKFPDGPPSGNQADQWGAVYAMASEVVNSHP